MKSYTKLLSFLLLATASITCWAQVELNEIVLLNKQVLQFEKAEWAIRVEGTFKNPYNQYEVALDMLLESPTGKLLLLPCYWENGNNWKARFTPQESGLYTYNFRLTTKADAKESARKSFNVAATDKPGFLHKNDLWTFRFDNGKLFRGIGENVGWESRSFENDKWTYRHLLPTLAKNGANFFRTWMCYWNMPLEFKKVGSTKRYSNTSAYYHPEAIEKMDDLVNLCDSLNLYFMLSIDWHGHLMQGGGWRNSNYNEINGGPAKNPADFFTVQGAQEMYKNKLRYLVARWGYSPNIAVWEFFNEIDNAAFTRGDSIIIPLNTIAQWHLEMSRYLKDIDPYQHLVSTSISHRDILGMNSIPYIDFNQKHIYKHTGKIPFIYADYIQTYNKPYVIGEFGYRWEDDDPKYGDEWDFDYKRGLWYGMFHPTPILPMTWWWELFDDRNMTPYFRSVKEINEKMIAAGKGSFMPFRISSGTLESYAVECGATSFIYLLNNTAAIDNSSIVIPGIKGSYNLQSFDPDTRTYKTIPFTQMMNGIKVSGLSIPSKREVILIATKK
jgi:hypothetical protein